MRVILKWKGISKFCEWNFNSLDLVAIIQKKKITFYAGHRVHLYSAMIC